MQRRLASNSPSCPPLIQFTVLGSSIAHIQKLENSNCWQSTNENRSPLHTQAAPRCPLLEVCGVSKAQAPLRVVREGDRVMQPFLPPPISACFSSELPQRTDLDQSIRRFTSSVVGRSHCEEDAGRSCHFYWETSGSDDCWIWIRCSFLNCKTSAT